MDPDLIAQITAQVRKQVLDDLKSSGVGVSAPAQLPQQPQYIPRSPATSTTASFPSRNVYTPPSPSRHEFDTYGSNSPEPLPQDVMYDGSGDTLTPRHERSAQTHQPYERTPQSRPAPAPRISTEIETTTVEKIWQPLFDSSGQPTARLGQFLRGLAVHIIDDYEPKKSIVITPQKMANFYDDVKLSDEIYPWSTIFGKLPNSTLSKIYRDMRCEHYLIQDSHFEVPHVPALTPNGFQAWMTAMIQAYPDSEYDRLSKAVLDMPISNADDCRERFPKELPRRLFPKHENIQAQQRCAAALSADGMVPLKKAPTFPPPPPMGPMGAPPPNLERDRSTYGGPADSDDDDGPLAIPIERERKPYSSAPGGGKIYDNDPASMSSSLKSDTETHTRHRRSQSSASQSSYIPSGRPSDYPPPMGHSRHHRTGSHLNGRRAHSPSFSNPGTRSDTHIPEPYYSTSNIYDTDEDNRRFAKDAETKRNDWARRQAEEDAATGTRRTDIGISASSYGSQPRTVYDDEYYRGRGGSNGYDNKSYGPQYSGRGY